MVRLAGSYRVPEDEIVQAVINPATGKPISPVTLRKHFREELRQGFIQGKMRIMAATFQSATGVKDELGNYVLNPNVTAQIWLGKVLYGMRETATFIPGAPPREGEPGTVPLDEGAEGVTLEAARRVAFTLAMGAGIASRRTTIPPKTKKP